jgi:O-antigen/teichoic acid export membrane protein
MNLFKKFTAVFFSNQLSTLFLFLASILIARIYGPEGRGYIYSILVIPNLVSSLTEFGMRQTAVYFIGIKKPISLVISNLFTYLLLAGLVGIIISFAYFYMMNKELKFEYILASLLVLNILLVNGFRAVFLGYNNFSEYNKFVVLQSFITFILLVILYFTSFNNVELVFCIYYISSFLVFTLISLKVFKSYLTKFKYTPSLLFVKKMLHKSFSYGIVFALVVMNYKFDIIMLSIMSNDYNLGLYTVSTQLIEIIWLVPAALIVVLFSISANNLATIEQLCAAIRATLLGIIIICALIILLGRLIITFLFGESFLGAYESLIFLLPGAVLMIFFKLIYAYYAGKGKPHKGLKPILLAVFINIVLNYLLIPIYHELGAALASSVSYSIAGLAMLLVFKFEFKVNFKDLLLIKISDLRSF